jgi:hypothetical protein
MQKRRLTRARRPDHSHLLTLLNQYRGIAQRGHRIIFSSRMAGAYMLELYLQSDNLKKSINLKKAREPD